MSETQTIDLTPDDREISVELNDPKTSIFTLYLPESSVPSRISLSKLPEGWLKILFHYDGERTEASELKCSRPEPWIKFCFHNEKDRLIWVEFHVTHLLQKKQQVNVAFKKLDKQLRSTYSDPQLRPINRLSAEYARKVLQNHSDTLTQAMTNG